MITALILIALKSMLVAVVTLGLLRLAARRSAAERSTIAHLGLCALLALPLASFLLPSLSILPPQQAVLKVLQAPIAVTATSNSAQAAVTVVASTEGLAHWTGAFVLCAYLLPAAALLLFTCAALLLLFRLRTRAHPVSDPSWLDALDRAQCRMGFTRGTALLSGGDVSSPISWGLIRPTILLNAEVLAAPAQAEAIIAHELAHMIQHDWAKLILARIVTAAFWFNPLAWLLAREAHQLREEAADDSVLAADISGPDYAALLIGVARCESRGFLSVVHGVAPSRTSLRRRVTRVLDDKSVRAVPGKGRVAAWTTAVLFLAAPLAALGNVPPAPKLPAGLPVAKSVQPQVSLAQLPQILRTTLDAECAGKGGTPGSSPNLFATADLNGDGIPDLVFDRKNYACRGAASPMGDSRFGTNLTIFLAGAANNVAEVYTGSFYGSRVQNNHDGKASLTVATTAGCGKPETCGRPVVLDTAKHSFVVGTAKK